jgi:ribonuclease P protein component
LPADQSRFGVITGRVVGGAVQRNKIKRRITSAIRSELIALDQPIDGVFRMRSAALDCDYVVLQAAVKAAFSKVKP